MLKVDNCQVVAQRTAEKNGYTAVQLGVGLRKVENTPQGAARPFRQGVGRAEAQGRRVPRQPRQPRRGRRGDHRRSFRRRPVRRRHRHVEGQGFPGRHEALEFQRRPRHARQLGLASRRRVDRPAPGSRQGVQGQEDGRSPRRRAGHDPEPEDRADRHRTRPDHGRGRGSRRQRRLDSGQRRGQARAAEGGAEARRHPQA